MKYSLIVATTLAVAAAGAPSARAVDAVTGAAAEVAIDRAKANIEGAKDERGEVAKGVKAATGISVEAIKKDGIFGGSNSVFHKPFGNLF